MICFVSTNTNVKVENCSGVKLSINSEEQIHFVKTAVIVGKKSSLMPLGSNVRKGSLASKRKNISVEQHYNTQCGNERARQTGREKAKKKKRKSIKFVAIAGG